ncbi:MAG TPA: hypothetical protein VFQ53_22370 [Kofleriaceae bacterium]|nr:hypothetical protein [Kofleriaceae bacterium]
MSATRAAVFAQPDNAPVLAYLGATPGDRFVVGDPSPFDEGGTIFARWSRAIPDACRCTLGTTNLLVHEQSGRVFAFHTGRFTIAIRSGVVDGRVRGVTADGGVDLRPLGPGWELYDREDDEDDGGDAFVRAHELAGG